MATLKIDETCLIHKETNTLVSYPVDASVSEWADATLCLSSMLIHAHDYEVSVLREVMSKWLTNDGYGSFDFEVNMDDTTVWHVRYTV